MLKALVLLFAFVSPTTNAVVRKVEGHPPNAPTQNATGKPSTDQRGTKDSPLVVDLEKSGETTYEAAENKARDDAEATYKVRELWLTFVIAGAAAFQAIGVFVQVCVYRKQSRLMLKGLVINREIAELSQKSLIQVHRPKIIVRTFYFSETKGVGGLMDDPFGIAANSFARGQFYIVNVGGTKARIKEVMCEVYIGGKLPAKRPYEGKDGRKTDGVLASGASTTWLFSLESSMTADIANRIPTEEKVLYVLGWIGYEDDIGIYRMTRFCRRYENALGRFRPIDPDDDYESAD